ncbi:MAG: hypothetical protein K1W05_03990 [Desulfovibrio sp.]
MNETMLNKEDMDKVDACILDQLVEKQEAIGTTDKALGEQAFGWVTYPNMKIQVIKGKGGKKPQQLRFTDIVNLCEALGLSWVDVCKEAVKSSKNK